MDNVKETVLTEAHRIVSGSRRDDYGDVKDNFWKIANLWQAYLDVEISCYDVAHMMMLLKIARNVHSIQRDNLTDICGYARCAEMLWENQA